MTDKSEHRLALEARASELKVKVPGNIGDDTLAARVAEAEAQAAEAENTGLPAALVVYGPKAGRWRAGRHFTAEGRTVPLDNLTDQEIAQIKGDPHLVVTERPAD